MVFSRKLHHSLLNSLIGIRKGPFDRTIIRGATRDIVLGVIGVNDGKPVQVTVDEATCFGLYLGISTPNMATLV